LWSGAGTICPFFSVKGRWAVSRVESGTVFAGFILFAGSFENAMHSAHQRWKKFKYNFLDTADEIAVTL
jgi:hypothetical protein